MDVENPRFEEYMARFEALSEKAEKVAKAPPLDTVRLYLCLFGENGLSVEQEFESLDELAQAQQSGGTLRKIEVETSYWQDTILFIP